MSMVCGASVTTRPAPAFAASAFSACAMKSGETPFSRSMSTPSKPARLHQAVDARGERSEALAASLTEMAPFWPPTETITLRFCAWSVWMSALSCEAV